MGITYLSEDFEFLVVARETIETMLVEGEDLADDTEAIATDFTATLDARVVIVDFTILPFVGS